jgi:hypothetical protein
MVLSDRLKRWLSIGGAFCLVVGQFALYMAGTQEVKEELVVQVVISDECLEYVTQSPIQRLPNEHCIREIRYLNYRIRILLEEVNRVNGNVTILELEVQPSNSKSN